MQILKQMKQLLTFELRISKLINDHSINFCGYALKPKLFGTGIYLLAKFEGVTDRKLYRVNKYIISGHSLEHLCLALIPTLLSIMLIYRELKYQR